jgi:hypothetical protein
MGTDAPAVTNRLTPEAPRVFPARLRTTNEENPDD